MAYIWSRYILVHSLQTGTEIWIVLGFVEGGKLEKSPKNRRSKDENEQRALSYVLSQPC